MIAAVSDIHDNLANLDKVLNYCQQHKIKTIVCCGDVTNDDTLKYMSDNFIGQIYLAEGNVELYNQGINKIMFKNVNFLGRHGGVFEYNGKKIGICHEPYLVTALLEHHDDLDIIFYGHTHEPWERREGMTRVINPGNVAGTRHKASFATYDEQTGQLDLHILDEMS